MKYKFEGYIVLDNDNLSWNISYGRTTTPHLFNNEESAEMMAARLEKKWGVKLEVIKVIVSPS